MAHKPLLWFVHFETSSSFRPQLVLGRAPTYDAHVEKLLHIVCQSERYASLRGTHGCSRGMQLM
jgi:hypothetical protein